MKKLLAASAILAMAGLAFSAQTCTKSDFLCFESGPSQSLTTPFRVDSAGNMSVAGTGTFTGNVTQSANTTINGITTFAPPAVVTIASTTYLTPTSTFIEVGGGAGAVTWGLPGQTPYNTGLSTTSVAAGTFVILEGTSSVSTVTLSSNTINGADFWLGSGTRVIDNQHVIGLIYDSVQNVWKELFYR